MPEQEQLLPIFQKAQRAFTDRVHAVREDQWSAPTPCEEWSVSDLVQHMIDEHLWAAPLMHGQDLDAAGKIVEGTRRLPVEGGVGANLAEQWDEAITGSADAFTSAGALDRTVILSRGETPASDYLEEMIADLAVHAWDLGTAIGYSEPLPDDLVSHTYDWAKNMGDMSSTGMFKPPVDVPDDAPLIDRLVGLSGRQPS
jgi:uncharacterized protein (TIGR03086 family)